MLEDYDAKLQQYERVMQVVENLCSQISAAAELLKIRGLGDMDFLRKLAISDTLNLHARSKNWMGTPLQKTVPVSTKDRQKLADEVERDLEQSCFEQQCLYLQKTGVSASSPLLHPHVKTIHCKKSSR